ncbi:MAG: polyprenyl diphosphate synthase [Candidatus Pacebacteria bacterium]|nr:polyprenyl diphosphate synthase [Candidatus Paceibacterota bacterium]
MKLKHLALIPDGNRRWAKKKILNPSKGHEKGAERFEKLYTKIAEMKIPYFSFWGASYDNLTKRSKTEIKNLFNLMHAEFEKLLKDERVMESKIKINVIGRWEELFPYETQKLIKECINKTKNNNTLNLTFFLAYNGTDEIIDCISKIKERNLKVTEENIKNNLWTKDLPPVDFLIRTGVDNDPHNSAGFMMWDTSYSQLYFTKTLFPNFSEKELEKAINNFEERNRRYGK